MSALAKTELEQLQAMIPREAWGEFLADLNFILQRSVTKPAYLVTQMYELARDGQDVIAIAHNWAAILTHRIEEVDTRKRGLNLEGVRYGKYAPRRKHAIIQ